MIVLHSRLALLIRCSKFNRESPEIPQRELESPVKRILSTPHSYDTNDGGRGGHTKPAHAEEKENTPSYVLSLGRTKGTFLAIERAGINSVRPHLVV